MTNNIPTDRPTFHHGPEGEGFTCWRDDDGSSWWWRGDSFKDAFQLSGGFSAVRILLDELHPAPIVLEVDDITFTREPHGGWNYKNPGQRGARVWTSPGSTNALILDRLAIAEGLMKPPQETEQ